MMNFKKLLTLLMLIGLTVSAFSMQENFLVPHVEQQHEQDKKSSANVLKEKVGELAHEVFSGLVSVSRQLSGVQQRCAGWVRSVVVERQTSCEEPANQEQVKKCAAVSAFVHEKTASMQLMVSSLQETCSRVAKSLIEQVPPFKKVKKEVLRQTCSCMRTAKNGLHAVAQTINDLNLKLLEKRGELVASRMSEVRDVLSEQQESVKKITTLFKNDECLSHVS